MNKTALKKFATSARLELLERVELQAMKFGLTKEIVEQEKIVPSNDFFINGKPLTDDEKKQRNKLMTRLNEIGFDRVIDEVAYTWFNRFTALRFMEVNDYIPTKVRVLSSRDGQSNEPEMIAEALTLDLDLDKEKIYNYKMNNETEALFKYLIIQHCNDLNKSMPFMFETINDYTELLFPDGLLSTDSFIREMTNVEVIPEENWEKVEIIGWLYQYYISDENERVIQAKKRYKAEEIPFATQLFTPEWIVRYMVQNALGRYWIESHPEHKDLISNWEFYLENPNPENDFEEKLMPYINKELNVEDIKCFDPAMGSGHILVYMFDVLHEIYSKCGYMEREIPRLIIENNLYGLDIDDRAYQLASFSIVMKALEYNRRFLRSIKRQGLTMNLASIQETNTLTEKEIAYLAGESSGKAYDEMTAFLNQFKHAKSIGSLIKIESYDLGFLQERFTTISKQSDDLFSLALQDRLLDLFADLIKQASIMNEKYDVFITNPPYAGRRYLTPEVTKYIDVNYPDVKSDFFSSFIEYSFYATKENGQMGFMTPFVWMFISSYEKLRKNIIDNKNISSLIQLEYSGFDGATVPICTFTLRNYKSNTSGEYVRLSDFTGAANQPIKTLEAVENPSVSYRYSVVQENFNKIPGRPIGYWVNKIFLDLYTGKYIGNEFDIKEGVGTRNDSKFLRFYWEVSQKRIGNDKRWVYTDKAGEHRKWYMGFSYVMDWQNDGFRIKNYRNPDGTLKSRPQNTKYLFKEGVTWGKVGSGKPSFRWRPSGFAFNDAAPTIFGEESLLLLAFLNSNLFTELLQIQGGTLNITTGVISNLPLLKFNVEEKHILENILNNCIVIAKEDWDNNEISKDFNKHSLIKFRDSTTSIKKSYDNWVDKQCKKISELKIQEEKLNDIIISKYNLTEHISTTVKKEDITLNKNNYEKDINSFLSYFIGCTFGRYSLDEEGLIYAGGEFDPSRYKTFAADEDNIVPILEESYFEDDIVKRFEEFLTVTFSAETLEENLDFIADALVRRKNETASETIRRYLMNEFYKNHTQIYKKRPIYWLFTSGKEKAFNCLVYMHRYDKTTLSRIRTDYLHETQSRYDVQRQDLINIIEGDYTTREINAAKKKLTSLDKKIAELKEYDEVLHHMADMQIEIDLDDGVVVNYAKFKGLVAKI